MENIIEGNKLITEFMQVQNDFSDTYYLPEFGHYFNSYGQIEWNDCFRSNELKYHSSWDWLKPVIDKIINSIGIKTIDECNDEEWFQYNRISRMYIGIEIKLAFHYVVEFIKWYNKNNKL